VLLLYADPDDNHPSLEIYVKNLIIVPPYDQKKAVGRLAYSPDEVAELLGISRELVHDLLPTSQLGSVKGGTPQADQQSATWKRFWLGKSEPMSWPRCSTQHKSAATTSAPADDVRPALTF
jgi:hypothetical protein